MINFRDYQKERIQDIILQEKSIHLNHKENILSSFVKLHKKSAEAMGLILKGELVKSKDLIFDIGKQEFLQFILILDLGTLHILSDVIHTIDAWTGWDLWREINSNISSSKLNIHNFKEDVEKIKEDISVVYTKKESKKILSILSELRHLL